MFWLQEMITCGSFSYHSIIIKRCFSLTMVNFLIFNNLFIVLGLILKTLPKIPPVLYTHGYEISQNKQKYPISKFIVSVEV